MQFINHAVNTLRKKCMDKVLHCTVSNFKQPEVHLGVVLPLKYGKDSAKMDNSSHSPAVKLALAVGLGYMTWCGYRHAHQLRSLLPNMTVHTAGPIGSDDNIGPPRDNNFIADVVEKCAPSVVYIEIQDRNTFSVVSNGSGFVVGKDGTLITNSHVIVPAAKTNRFKVVVRTYDGKFYEAQIKAMDEFLDVAILKIHGGSFPVLKLGNGKTVRAGEWVIAIGSPLALTNSVTTGIVSYANRSGEDIRFGAKGLKYIQTDALITFGNSGGPLLNLKGEVIGLNSMKLTSGISFSLHIDHAKAFLERYQGGSGKQSPNEPRYLGVTLVTLDDTLMADLHGHLQFPPGLKNGVLILRVNYDSPGARAGLYPGDIITHVNKTAVTTAKEILTVFGQSDRDATLAIRIFRNGAPAVLYIQP